MYKHILVTLDGSEASEAVLAEVANAAARDTRVTLFTAAEPPGAVLSDPVGSPLVAAGAPAPGGVVDVPAPRTVENRDQAIARAETEHREYLERAAKGLRAKGLKIETKVALGNPAEQIPAFAAESGADLIMMATHGRTGLARAVFGSVAQSVVAAGKCPVLLVRPRNLK